MSIIKKNKSSILIFLILSPTFINLSFANSDTKNYLDFSTLSIDEIFAPNIDIGQRENEYRFDTKAITNGHLFETQFSLINLYDGHAKTLFNIDVTMLSKGMLHFNNCFDGICSKFYHRLFVSRMNI